MNIINLTGDNIKIDYRKLHLVWNLFSRFDVASINDLYDCDVNFKLY